MRGRRRRAADPADLDVDHLAGAEIEGGLRRAGEVSVSSRHSGVCSCGPRTGVVGEVVPVQRLLDVVQPELVDRAQHVEVVERVGRVGVDGQLDVGELGAHRPDSSSMSQPGSIFSLIRL